MPGNDSARPEFRKQLRQSSTFSNGNGSASEHTPLISGRHTGLSGDDDPDAGSGSGHSLLRRLLWDREDTPGAQSDNRFVRWAAHFLHVLKVVLYSSPVNFLLVFVPLGIISGRSEWSPVATFTLNFFAIIPLAAILSFATEQISERLGEALGGLLNATFGNAVELIVSVVALKQGQIEVVQASMLGSILSNLLLVLGFCFLLGGIVNMRDADGNGVEQRFASVTAQTTCSLMALASASLIIPATLYGVLNESGEEEKEASVLLLSRGTAIILLVLYVAYLVFQLHTHKNLFSSPAEDEEANRRANASRTENTNAVAGGVSRHNSQYGTNADRPAEHPSVEHQEVVMSPFTAVVVLILTTVVIAVCADYLVDTIDAIVATGAVSRTFIGLILIPIVGNAAEHVTACIVAIHNKMDLAMGVAIGSSIQIALLVTPFLVILGWTVLDQPMSLHFETFETVAFALSVLVVTYVVQDGNSNYLEGAMLLGLYVIIALAFYASPGQALDKMRSAITG